MKSFRRLQTVVWTNPSRWKADWEAKHGNRSSVVCHSFFSGFLMKLFLFAGRDAGGSSLYTHTRARRSALKKRTMNIFSSFVCLVNLRDQVGMDEMKDFFTRLSLLWRLAMGQPSFLLSSFLSFLFLFHSFIHSFIHPFIHSFACLTGSWIYGCVIVVLISKGEDIRTKGTHRRRSEEYPLYSTITTTHKDNSCGSKNGGREAERAREKTRARNKKRKREKDTATAISINRI